MHSATVIRGPLFGDPIGITPFNKAFASQLRSEEAGLGGADFNLVGQ